MKLYRKPGDTEFGDLQIGPFRLKPTELDPNYYPEMNSYPLWKYIEGGPSDDGVEVTAYARHGTAQVTLVIPGKERFQSILPYEADSREATCDTMGAILWDDPSIPRYQALDQAVALAEAWLRERTDLMPKLVPVEYRRSDDYQFILQRHGQQWYIEYCNERQNPMCPTSHFWHFEKQTWVPPSQADLGAFRPPLGSLEKDFKMVESIFLGLDTPNRSCLALKSGKMLLR